jgi:tRNA1Val (adenine37-N6)-methyltransferase
VRSLIGAGGLDEHAASASTAIAIIGLTQSTIRWFVAEETIDQLTRDWRIIQRRRGHRHSTDDLLTGWYAAEHGLAPRRVLDLGSGIGSVGLLVLWRAPAASLVAIEAQDVSFALLERNVALNGLESRVRAIHGDLRTTRLAERFELVTGSPPYFDVGAGIVPADSQKAHARFELRGDVRDYCAAAHAALSDDGRFVFCFPTVQHARAIAAIGGAGLALVRWREVVPREGLAPLFSLYCCALADGWTAAPVREPPHVVRIADGSPTAAHLAARATFGLG